MCAAWNTLITTLLLVVWKVEEGGGSWGLRGGLGGWRMGEVEVRGGGGGGWVALGGGRGGGGGGEGIGGKLGRKEQVAKLWNQICHCDHANSTMNTDTHTHTHTHTHAYHICLIRCHSYYLFHHAILCGFYSRVAFIKLGTEDERNQRS